MNPDPSSSPPRFTLDGSPELESHLTNICNLTGRVLARYFPKAKLQGLLLGGGYGRGEGGVLKTDSGDRPYNDLECYLFLRGNVLWNERRHRKALHELAHQLGDQTGVEVEFKVFSLPKLRASPVTMFYYDLIMGHRWILGDESLLAGCEHHREAAAIPLSEAARLLMNRCTGLLFAREYLGERTLLPWQADFVGRNMAKAELALGDAVLTVHRLYHWSCLERDRRLRELDPAPDMPWLDDVKARHRNGVRFKLHPYQAEANPLKLREQLDPMIRLAKQVWLWLESRRLLRDFDSVQDYALSNINKCPETRPMRNLLVNAKSTPSPRLCRFNPLRYPRERLLTALSLLLWEPFSSPPHRLPAKLKNELSAPSAQWSDLIRSYERLWRQYN